MINSIEKYADSIVFTPGDMMIASEFSTIRYSEKYKPTHKTDLERRWFLACSVFRVDPRGRDIPRH